MENPDTASRAERSASFWNVIEKKLKRIEPFIKHIITAKGLDYHEILGAKDEEIFDELETFVRNGEYERKISSLLPNRPLKEFYGPFDKVGPFHFFLMNAHKEKLVSMIKICRMPSLWANISTTKSSDSRKKMDVTSNDTFGPKSVREIQDSALLKLFKAAWVESDQKHKNCRKYRDALLKYCTYLYLARGYFPYHFLSMSLPILIPSAKAIQNHIETLNPRVDGAFQIKGLKKFLTNRKLPLNVWISEATIRCVECQQYNCRDNGLTGFVLPLDQNGMPKLHSFKFLKIADARRYLDNAKKSTHLHCFMAQPIASDAPPYCLALFGTDQSFTQEQSLKRWDNIARLLEQEGISVEGFCAENDPRLVKAMLVKSELGEKLLTNASNITGFCAEYLPKKVYFQDPVFSIMLLLNNRFLGSPATLAIGENDVIFRHLYWLILRSEYYQKNCPFTLNMLGWKYVLCVDMVVKICHPETIKMIEKIPNSEGTREYLKLMNFVLHSHLSTKLNALVRVYCLWYAVFLLRLWRVSQKKLSVEALEIRFIPFDTYVCIEINAHSLVNMILKNMNKPDFDKFFMPWQCSIMPCKHLFDLLRSPDCHHHKVVNCTPLEALRKLQKIELVDDITYDFCVDGEKLDFPGTEPFRVPFEKITSDSLCVNLENDPIVNQELSLSAIQNVVERAKQDAFQQILKLGVKNVVIEDCHEICEDIRSDDGYLTVEEYFEASDDEKAACHRENNFYQIEIAEECLDPYERTDFVEVMEIEKMDIAEIREV